MNRWSRSWRGRNRWVGASNWYRSQALTCLLRLLPANLILMYRVLPLLFSPHLAHSKVRWLNFELSCEIFENEVDLPANYLRMNFDVIWWQIKWIRWRMRSEGGDRTLRRLLRKLRISPKTPGSIVCFHHLSHRIKFHLVNMFTEWFVVQLSLFFWILVYNFVLLLSEFELLISSVRQCFSLSLVFGSIACLILINCWHIVCKIVHIDKRSFKFFLQRGIACLGSCLLRGISAVILHGNWCLPSLFNWLIRSQLLYYINYSSLHFLCTNVKILFLLFFLRINYAELVVAKFIFMFDFSEGD